MPKRQKECRWSNLDRKTQDRYIRLLWNDGYSEGAIADFFGVGKGVIVRRRQSHLGDLKPRDRRNVKSSLNPERFEDLLEIEQMDDIVEQGATPICPVSKSASPPKGGPTRPSSNVVSLPSYKARESSRPKLAASEATQCAHRDKDDLRCAYAWSDAASRLCELHKK